MSDGEELLIVLWLVYLTGCFSWLDRRTAAVASWWGRSWCACVANPLWGSAAGSLLLRNPVPAPGGVFPARIVPVSLSPTTLVACNLQCPSEIGRPDQSGLAVALSDIRSFESVGATLHVNGAAFCRFGGPETARAFAALLAELLRTPFDGRDEKIGTFWRSRLGLREAKDTIRRGRDAVRPLRRLCLGAFFLFFVGFPAAALSWGVMRTVIPCALAMFLSVVPIGMEYVRASRRLFPSGREGTKPDLFKMAFCPVKALRATDVLEEAFFSDLDPLPLLCLLPKGHERRAALERHLRDLAFPLGFERDLPPPAREACLYQNRKILEVAAECIPLVRRTLARLAIPPAKEAPDVVVHCPRCLSQFSIRHETCPHCGPGIVPIPFDAASVPRLAP